MLLLLVPYQKFPYYKILFHSLLSLLVCTLSTLSFSTSHMLFAPHITNLDASEVSLHRPSPLFLFVTFIQLIPVHTNMKVIEHLSQEKSLEIPKKYPKCTK